MIRFIRPSRRMAAAALPFVLIAAACGHDEPAASPTTEASTGGDDTTSTTPEAAGAFGTLEGVCGPGDGAAVPSTARGVTDDAIQIGVLNDATNTIVPGLGQIYVDIAPAFAEWCNAAGGINGRRIEFVSRDAQLVNSAAAVIEACQSDFMLVGGATPLDAPTVEPRLECDLGAIPAYTASPEATESDLQVFSPARRSDQANVAAFRMLADDHSDAYARTGILAIDQASLLPRSSACATRCPRST